MITAADIALRKLERFGPMSAEERAALQEGFGTPVEIRAGRDIVADGALVAHCTVVLSGFGCRYKVLPDGGRQITAFQIPGDICDLYSYLIPTLDHGIGALTPCMVSSLPHAFLTQLIERFPAMGRRLWRETIIDASIARQWVTGLGRRSAHQRVAHLLCEMKSRMETVGLCLGTRFEFPFTQADLGDAFGLSIVHVNRVLQALRRDGLITLEKRWVHILQWDKLVALAGFDPSYLHLKDYAAKLNTTPPPPRGLVSPVTNPGLPSKLRAPIVAG